MSTSGVSDMTASATAFKSSSSPKLRQRNRILSAQNHTAHPQIDAILAAKEDGSGSISQGGNLKPEPKAVSTARPTSPLMPIVRSLEKLGEKVPSLPKMPGMPDIKLPASSIEVK
ncbi:hypothetical protein QFC19_005842 [Naganishia cerealis]|uniref:Uncharacterized protein n=1 Tax=Naganishia cerealis TaxID=610337 RepID=A0ACC2VLM0_9TREE|nr:hypothetical protein QFC19_005842 [Naganishia cerealis]